MKRQKIERNIVQEGIRFLVEVTRRRVKVFAKASFGTIEEARSYRDAVEAQFSASPPGPPAGESGTVALGPREYQRRRRVRMIAEGMCPSCSGTNPEKRSQCKGCREFYNHQKACRKA